ESFIETNRIDDKRIAFPLSSGVPIIARLEIFGMRAAVHIDRAERMRTADIHDEDSLQIVHFNELDTIWSQKLARPAGRFAAGMRLELIGTPVREQGTCPILERKFVRLRRPRFTRCTAGAGQPEAGFTRKRSKQHSPIRTSRCRTRRRNPALRTNRSRI